MSTRTIKLVVIGDSGVGKTSLRGQYISGRFSSGYRATIGADFITKTLPHPHRSDESVIIQIWDTAGQERFSSLSTAFFRGADAVILMFDTTQPKTLGSLKKWWSEFKQHAPVHDEDVAEFCTVFVGNKTDLRERRVRSASEATESSVASDTSATPPPWVTEADAAQFVKELIPVPSSSRSASPGAESLLGLHTSSGQSRTLHSWPRAASPPSSSAHSPKPSNGVSFPSTATSSIAIHPRKSTSKSTLSRSRSRSLRQFVSGTFGTVNTTTTLSIYHTPSSSVFEGYETAQSSPSSRLTSRSSSYGAVESRSGSPRSSHDGRGMRRMASLSLSMNSDAATITPQTYRERTLSAPSPAGSPYVHRLPPLPPRPERRPRLFFTSAKTGNGVVDVFQHIAERVLRKWEFDEAVEARRMSVLDEEFDTTIRLGTVDERRGRSWAVKPMCCA